ncbi:MAG: GNAT family N-acetyltransferase [Chloroflexota bacterium]|nr:GNAT family N-acetyltransferase [Chloroflexota bacterium]MDE2896000.1 GNAT family N-acetyltransferase [Chloroflexota bacterium]
MSDVIIREAVPNDAQTILDFIVGLAEFENEPRSIVEATVESISRDGFGDNRLFETLIAERDGEPLGMALFFPHYSTWTGTPVLYLEDLFVKQEARGSGAGFALMQALAEIAEARGWKRLDLSVLDWNPARRFYHRLGMEHESEWLLYRLDEDGIANLAQTGRDG